ncbi:hypothetical protein REC12_06230 [Desulfosporosinus sp. PR]|uniref:hypothetical protein n=1 Tax=Candidatus Desulfosporosinus nitrosoreducens TaxID=3401928 RepID=UPI0027E9162A|nr:hypothetical protein [Desulfosporosinus sp. PR]MDQ7093182.1 hypothetical protein [Desulfosporosinus sp. PR]
MSFVSIVISNSFVSAMADSRTIELYANGTIHRIKSENHQKIFLLSDQVFMAIAGLVEDAQKFIDSSNLEQAILESGLLESKDVIAKWLESVRHYVITNYNFKVFFGGMTIANELKVYIIDSTIRELEELEYSEKEIGYYLSPSQYIDKTWVENLFKELYRLYDGTPETMKVIQEMLNDIIANNDMSVNKNKRWFCLRR